MFSAARSLRRFALVLASALTFGASAKAGDADRLAWFREAKFGLFIHWGLYAVPAGAWKDHTDLGEWFQLEANLPAAEYGKFADQFDPVKFDAKAWVRAAKDAGMKYLVFTAKHHDGFCMWPTKLTDWSIERTPWWRRTHRDIVAELADACHEAGLIFCFYYSVPDWNYPDFPQKYSQTSRGKPGEHFHGNPKADADLDKYVAFVKGQLRELLTNYGKIGIIWFDHGAAFKKQNQRALMHSDEIVALIHQLQPDCLINNRIGSGMGDYGTPEQFIPGGKATKPFEVCMTMNEHWGFNAADQHWKSAESLTRNLIDIVSKGGNYLLNVGPMANGEFPAPALERLAAIGRWTHANGEAIYGTTASPLAHPPTWGRLTMKGSTLYPIVFNWPRPPAITIDGLDNPVKSATILADGKPLTAKTGPDGIDISLPEKAPDPTATALRLEMSGPIKISVPAPAKTK